MIYPKHLLAALACLLFSVACTKVEDGPPEGGEGAACGYEMVSAKQLNNGRQLEYTVRSTSVESVDLTLVAEFFEGGVRVERIEQEFIQLRSGVTARESIFFAGSYDCVSTYATALEANGSVICAPVKVGTSFSCD